MTEAQAQWLRKLRDEGPQAFAYDRAAASCYRFDWTDCDAQNTREWITPAGLAALAAHEQGSGKEA
jgi:hypothetical protein